MKQLKQEAVCAFKNSRILLQSVQYLKEKEDEKYKFKSSEKRNKR